MCVCGETIETRDNHTETHTFIKICTNSRLWCSNTIIIHRAKKINECVCCVYTHRKMLALNIKAKVKFAVVCVCVCCWALKWADWESSVYMCFYIYTRRIYYTNCIYNTINSCALCVHVCCMNFIIIFVVYAPRVKREHEASAYKFQFLCAKVFFSLAHCTHQRRKKHAARASFSCAVVYFWGGKGCAARIRRTWSTNYNFCSYIGIGMILKNVDIRLGNLWEYAIARHYI